MANVGNAIFEKAQTRREFGGVAIFPFKLPLKITLEP